MVWMWFHSFCYQRIRVSRKYILIEIRQKVKLENTILGEVLGPTHFWHRFFILLCISFSLVDYSCYTCCIADQVTTIVFYMNNDKWGGFQNSEHKHKKKFHSVFTIFFKKLTFSKYFIINIDYCIRTRIITNSDTYSTWCSFSAWIDVICSHESNKIQSDWFWTAFCIHEQCGDLRSWIQWLRQRSKIQRLCRFGPWFENSDLLAACRCRRSCLEPWKVLRFTDHIQCSPTSRPGSFGTRPHIKIK